MLIRTLQASRNVGHERLRGRRVLLFPSPTAGHTEGPSSQELSTCNRKVTL